MKVWVLFGWFGSEEWVEDIYSNVDAAIEAMQEKWKTRSSEKGPEYSRGLHKFGVDEWEVKDA